MNPVETYKQRQLEKKAAKEAEELAKKKADLEAKTRKPADIKKDADEAATEIGKWHHQLKCCESNIASLTDKFHALMIELGKSKDVFPEEFKSVLPATEGPVDAAF